jgi:hypothetical protein
MSRRLTGTSGRNVYGKDVVVVYQPKIDTIVVREVLACQAKDNRFTPEKLLASLGCDVSIEPDIFLRNNNVHDTRNGLKGVLVLINLQIGLIVRSIGSFILFQVLLPKAHVDEVILIDLRIQNRICGFFLQQIHGTMVGSITVHCRHNAQPYPYLVEGNLYMDPGGPHCFVSKSLSQIPQSLLIEFQALNDNLCKTSYDRVSSSDRNRRKSKYSEVIYMIDDKTRTRLAELSDQFYVPIGDPYGAKLCPWRHTSENYAEYVHINDCGISIFMNLTFDLGFITCRILLDYQRLMQTRF